MVVSMWTYLGQNFLIDAKIRHYIADKISVLYEKFWCEALIEIWPGKGSITKLIHSISSHFLVIEKDSTLIPNLKLQISNLKCIEWDVLDVDVEKFLQEKNIDSKNTFVVGNLPYYITSPILRKFFSDPAKDGTGCQQNFAWGLFMVQDEVGQKVKYDAKKKSYLRWLLNYTYTVTYVKTVPAKAFKPIPRVKSCLIQLTPTSELPKFSWDTFIHFLELFAPYSRKTLWAIQKMIKKKSDILFDIPLSLQKKRLEEMSREDIATILWK